VKLNLLKWSLRFWMSFQMLNCKASFEVGVNVLKGWLTQKGIIWPRKYPHLPCLIIDRLLYG
jgi:hypothetical protein